MGVGIYLVGSYPEQNYKANSFFLEDVARWLRAAASEDLIHSEQRKNTDDQNTLYVRLHPCSEDMEVVELEAGRVLVSAKTSVAGPGYHIYLCDLLEKLGQALCIRWDPPDEDDGSGDETGYFHSGDKRAVEKAMLEWLGALAGYLVEEISRESSKIPVNLDLDIRYEFDGVVGTPMGPRDMEWLLEVWRNPRQGIDIFPWWKEGKNAEYWLGRALFLMWTDVRWRPPISDEEESLLSNVIEMIEKAYGLDPSLNYPLREWQEILRYIQRPESTVPSAKQAPDLGSLIGYRRRPVAVQIGGGWWVKIPGSFLETTEDDGKTWLACENGRNIRISFWEVGAEGSPVPSADDVLAQCAPLDPLKEGERHEYRAGSLVGTASLKKVTENSDIYWILHTRSAVPGNLAAATITFVDDADLDWAIRTWHSISYNEPLPQVTKFLPFGDVKPSA